MRRLRVAVWVLACAISASAAEAAEVRAEMRQATQMGPGDAIGTVTIADSPAGASVRTALRGLPAGPHGFHVHANGSCAPGPASAGGQPEPAGAAGGHFDPGGAGKHEGPQGAGHLGDLPVLQAAADGNAAVTLTAPNIKDVTQLRGKALIVHAGADNYRDQPAANGGGGARIACGVIE